MKIGAPDGELAAADAYCRFLAERHYENFTVASRLIAPSLRCDLARIYAYARTTDDLGDENQREALARLQRWRDEVVALFAGRSPLHPVLIALRETIRERRLGQQPFLDLIAANVQDQSVTSYETWPQLEAYCRLSAAPVGRMVLGVFGIDGAEAERLSDDVCIGLQLANFAQDVARDAALGRTYLLQVDLREGGQTAATRALCKRARELLASGKALERMAPFALRAQLALYRLGGLAICDAIEKLGYRTDLTRPEVSKRAKLALVVRAAYEALQPARGAERVEPA